MLVVRRKPDTCSYSRPDHLVIGLALQNASIEAYALRRRCHFAEILSELIIQAVASFPKGRTALC